nr:YkgJ family cysteine cluster protein [uncultured Holophaga sp.]
MSGEDRAWLEEHVLKGGGLLVYGRLAEELEELEPEEVLRELRAAAEAYLADGESRTALAHARADRLIEVLLARDRRFGYPEPFCHRGCAECCHEVVYATGEEAWRILDYCGREGISLDLGRLRRQLAHVDLDERGDHRGGTTWSEQPEADQACVFLGEDQACRVWPVRPLVCRAHLAEGSDRFCRPRNGVENPEAHGISYMELAYLITAVFTIHRDSARKTLPGLLLAMA